MTILLRPISRCGLLLRILLCPNIKSSAFFCYSKNGALCYTQRRRDNFPGTQFFLDKLLILKKGLVQGIPKQLAESKKNSEFFDGSLSPSENRTLGEKALSGQMLLELNLSLPLPYV